MNKVTETLTVYFAEPFWVGVFEKIEDGALSVARVTFGSEPKDYEVYDAILKHYSALRFSPAVEVEEKDRKKNPKRMQRDVGKQLQNTGSGTKSQQALKLLQEQCETEHRHRSREQKEAEEARRFELKQQKRKEKHRGH